VHFFKLAHLQCKRQYFDALFQICPFIVFYIKSGKHGYFYMILWSCQAVKTRLWNEQQ